MRKAGKNFWVNHLGFICGLLLVLGSVDAGAAENFVAATTGDFSSGSALYYLEISAEGTMVNAGIPLPLPDIATPEIFDEFSINAVGVADFDNDEAYDIIFAHGASGTFYFYSKNGSGPDFLVPTAAAGTFDSCFPNTTDNCAAQKIAVSDFNNDGNMDFLISGQNSKLQVFLGNGDGSFDLLLPTQELGNNQIMFGKDAEDVDGDGRVDVVTAVHDGDYFGNNKLYVWMGNGDGTFVQHTISNLDGYSTDPYDPSLNLFGQGVAIEDYDCDMIPDIVLTVERTPKVKDTNTAAFALMHGNGDGDFGSPSPLLFPDGGFYDNQIPDVEPFYFGYQPDFLTPDVLYSLYNIFYSVTGKYTIESLADSCGAVGGYVYDNHFKSLFAFDDIISIATPREGVFCHDVDGDGYFVEEGCEDIIDCNDSDAAINPGVTEVCNGIDDNCNGVVDEGFDADGDGFTICAGDCDDSDADVNPDAAEVCDDGIDNNCDGEEAVTPVVDQIIVSSNLISVDDGLVTAEVEFTDFNLFDVHTVTWNWGDGSPSYDIVLNTGDRTTSQSHNYSNSGVYTVSVTVSDGGCGSSTLDYRYVVVYDPSEGFVTGGGWILSPAGAYKSDGTLTGQANFGFVSKYKKGATTPTGQTQFQFRVADLNFHSDNYDWLVVAGAKAQFKGTGTINGAGNFGFLLTAIDEAINGGGDVDKFRIKIWDKDNGDQIVYDNNLAEEADDADPTTEIGGGSIVIHN